MPLPAVVIIVSKYDSEKTANKFYESAMAENTVIIVWANAEDQKKLLRVWSDLISKLVYKVTTSPSTTDDIQDIIEEYVQKESARLLRLLVRATRHTYTRRRRHDR